MYTIDNLQIIGSGATATVYLLDNKRIIKVFNSEYSIDSVKYEAHLSEEISKTGILSPKYHGLVKVNNHDAIISEYIPGDVLLGHVVKSSITQCVKLVKKMVQIQKSIHLVNCTSITSQFDRFTYLINATSLSDTKKETILKHLHIIGHDTKICHGDYHPGNIIINSNNDLYTIDWMNCYFGDPIGDVVRSYLTLISPFIPFKLPIIKKIMFLLYKRLLGEIYLHEYRKETSIKRKDINKWIPIIAAGRLADNIPNEGKWLVKLIDQKSKYLTTAST